MAEYDFYRIHTIKKITTKCENKENYWTKTMYQTNITLLGN
jgi:hypothetical protein